MINTIIFDIGGVVLSYNKDELESYMIKSTGVSIYSSEAALKYREEFTIGGISTDVYLDKLRRLAEKNISLSELKNKYSEAYIDSFQIYKPILELIKKLRNRYKIICLTNTNEFHYEINKKRGLFDYFDKVVSSHLEGKSKPDPAIYKSILNQHRINSGEAVFIDDNIVNVKAAVVAGIDAIHFKDYNSLLSELKKRGVTL